MGQGDTRGLCLAGREGSTSEHGEHHVVGGSRDIRGESLDGRHSAPEVPGQVALLYCGVAEWGKVPGYSANLCCKSLEKKVGTLDTVA